MQYSVDPYGIRITSSFHSVDIPVEEKKEEKRDELIVPYMFRQAVGKRWMDHQTPHSFIFFD